MTWKLPPRIKVFEALGSLVDGRVRFVDENGEKLSFDPLDYQSAQDDKTIQARIESSDGSKFYTVKYDESINAITSNDNGSRWQGYLGYPSIALLMKLGKLPFDQALADGLKGIAWKAINTKYKNDWVKTETEIFENLDRGVFEQFAERVLRQITDLKLNR